MDIKTSISMDLAENRLSQTHLSPDQISKLKDQEQNFGAVIDRAIDTCDAWSSVYNKEDQSISSQHYDCLYKLIGKGETGARIADFKAFKIEPDVFIGEHGDRDAFAFHYIETDQNGLPFRYSVVMERENFSSGDMTYKTRSVSLDGYDDHWLFSTEPESQMRIIMNAVKDVTEPKPGGPLLVPQ